jgi:hypothetical protein
LDYSGRQAFAELIILWSMNSAGWDGVWIDTFSDVYRTGYWDSPKVRDLPAEPDSILSRIYQAKGSESGAWDVFCWHGQEVVFVESKRKGKDRIRESQVLWLQAALDVGYSLSNFLVVEWSLAEPGGSAQPTKKGLRRRRPDGQTG